MIVKIDSEKCLIFLICYLFGGEVIQKAFQTCLRDMIAIPYHLDTLLIYALLGLCLLASLREIRKDYLIIELFAGVTLCLLVFISWAQSSGYDEMFFSIGRKLVVGLIGFFLFRSISDYKRVMIWMERMAYLITISLFLYLMMTGGINALDTEYSMYYGYLVFPAVIISIKEVFRTKKISQVMNAIFGLILTFAMGVRGPLLCEVVFIFIVLFFHTGSKIRRIVELVAVAIASTIIFKYFYTILGFLFNIFTNYGLSTRSILKLEQGAFFYSSGRESIRKVAFNIFNEHTLSGVGLGRDRILISSNLGKTPDVALGCYPHNLFLEIIMQFGIVCGSVLLIALVLLIVSPIIVRKLNEAELSVYIICFAVGFLPLMFSNSYLTAPTFFYMLGVNVAILTDKKIDKKTFIQKNSTVRNRVIQNTKFIK